MSASRGAPALLEPSPTVLLESDVGAGEAVASAGVEMLGTPPTKRSIALLPSRFLSSMPGGSVSIRTLFDGVTA